MTRWRTIIPAAALAVSLTFALGACAASGAQLQADLHGSVVQVAERAADGDYAGALAELALLDRDVTAAADDNRLDAEQEAEIREAMELVRADLEAAEVASTPARDPPAEPADDDDSGPGNSDDKQKGNDKDKGKKNDD